MASGRSLDALVSSLNLQQQTVDNSEAVEILNSPAYSEPGENEVCKAVENFARKFEVKSQLHKADALRKFKAKTLGSENQTHETKRLLINSLWFVRCLSRDPIRSSYDYFQQPEVVFPIADVPAENTNTQMVPNGHVSYFVSLHSQTQPFCGSESSLSVWSSDGEESPEPEEQVILITPISPDLESLPTISDRPPSASLLCTRPYWRQSRRVMKDSCPVMLNQIEAIREVKWCLCGGNKLLLFDRGPDGVVKLSALGQVANISWIRLEHLLRPVCQTATTMVFMQNWVDNNTVKYKIAKALKSWLKFYMATWSNRVHQIQRKSLDQFVSSAAGVGQELLSVYNLLEPFLNTTIYDYIWVQDLLLAVFESLDLAPALEPNQTDVCLDLFLCLCSPSLSVIEELLRTGKLRDETNEFFLEFRSDAKYRLVEERLCKCEPFNKVASELALAAHSVRLVRKLDINSSVGVELNAGQLYSTIKADWLSERLDYFTLPSEHVNSTLECLVVDNCRAATRQLMEMLVHGCKFDLLLQEFKQIYSLFVLDEFCLQIFEKSQSSDGINIGFVSSAFDTSLQLHGWKQERIQMWKVSLSGDHIQLEPNLDAVLSHVIRESHLGRYNQVLSLLMRVTLSRRSLVSDWYDWNPGRVLWLRFRLLNTLNLISSILSAQVHSALDGYATVCAADNIEQALKAHDKVVDHLLSCCFMTNKHEVVLQTIVKLADLAPKLFIYCKQETQNSETENELMRSYTRCCRLLRTTLDLPVANI